MHCAQCNSNYCIHMVVGLGVTTSTPTQSGQLVDYRQMMKAQNEAMMREMIYGSANHSNEQLTRAFIPPNNKNKKLLLLRRAT